jgi:2-amino-4-hydroxy-6-hydroxymethyldihydropteridine diphosphokinase
MSHTVYIALGTNIGDRAENMQQALKKLESIMQVEERSPIYETPPWGLVDQPDFLNQVVRGETELSPVELIKALKEIEAEMGRVPTIRYGPRLIDLDLLFYDDLVFETEKLSIPHPRMRGRAFVLVPLADLAPEIIHPVYGETVIEMLAEVDPAGIHVYSDDED